MLTRHDDYMELVRSFAWKVPDRYNIGVDVCDRHADDPGRVALIVEEEDGTVRRHTFAEIRAFTNRLCNVLVAHGLQRGDRLAVLLPQAPETAIAHVAGFKAGLITIPLFSLFGAEALEYRLGDSGARVLVTDRAGYEKVAPLRDRLPALELVLCIDGAPEGTVGFQEALAGASDVFAPVDTGPDDPAVIIYTSGTTGSPKGALHGHRVLLGHLPGVELPHEFFPQPDDLFWTPADWAWIGGLFDVLMPAWHHGVPVLAHRFRKFDPHEAVELMKRHNVRNVFLPPTAIKLMRRAGVTGEGLKSPHGRQRRRDAGGELLEWGRSVFGVTINEFYGQTECNLVVGNAAAHLGFRAGSMGRAIPGHRVEVIDERGDVVPSGTVGAIAIQRPDPVMFLGYWNKPDATRDKFIGDWLVTGDLGRRDEDGFFWYVGRDDDVITSGGYRIGPGEVEECLLGHPAVAMAAVIGVPDPIRTEIVKAYVVLRAGVEPSTELACEIQEFVKVRLAAHEYPREVAFVAELPMTVTGKVMRRVLRSQAAEEAAASQGKPA